MARGKFASGLRRTTPNMATSFATSFGPLGVVLLLSVPASAQQAPEETKSPVSNESAFLTMATTTERAPVGLINAGPAIEASAQILFALTSELPVSQLTSNV
jgi:hypothetical protein